MTPGFAIVWHGQVTLGYLTETSQWSIDPRAAHVFPTWATAKKRARAFKGAEVVEAWT